MEPIDYVDRPGLMDAIRAAGHRVEVMNGVVQCTSAAAVQAIIDAYTLDDAKARKCADCSALAKTLRDKVVRPISAGEMASWPIKLAEARSFAADGDAAKCPMLTAEAAVRGITVAELASKVDGNATTFSALETQIAGTDGMHRDAINALATFEGVASYDYSTGWPEV